MYEGNSISYLTPQMLKNEVQEEQKWNLMKFRKTNFDYEINTTWQKVIQINEADVYFIGGMNFPGLRKNTKKCYKLNLRQRSIERIANILEGRSGFGICNLGNKIYIIGGIQIRFIYLIGGLTDARNQEPMSEILRIDTFKDQEEMKWESIQLTQDDPNNLLRNKCQIGIMNLGLLYPNEQSDDKLQLILFGGLHRFNELTSELFHMTINHNNDEEQQVISVEIKKIKDKGLTVQDRIYYNQWLAMQNTRDCKEWFMIGRYAGHFIKFPQSLSELQDIEIQSNENLGYAQLLDRERQYL
eukprot:403355267